MTVGLLVYVGVFPRPSEGGDVLMTVGLLVYVGVY